MLYFSFSIPIPGFSHLYYMLGANLGLLLYGEVSVMSPTSRFFNVNFQIQTALSVMVTDMRLCQTYNQQSVL